MNIDAVDGLVASRSGVVDGGNYVLNDGLQRWPVILADLNNSNFARCQVLLVLDFLIAGNKDFEAAVFGELQKVSVSHTFPDHLFRRHPLMMFQVSL